MRRWLALLVVVAAGFGVWKWYTNEDAGSIQFTTGRRRARPDHTDGHGHRYVESGD
jgi:hypothetical protein